MTEAEAEWKQLLPTPPKVGACSMGPQSLTGGGRVHVPHFGQAPGSNFLMPVQDGC